MITATQKVLIVCGVKHVEHEIRRSLKDFVAQLALFLPAIVDHRQQAGNLLFVGGQLDFRHHAHSPPSENSRYRLMRNAKSVSNAD